MSAADGPGVAVFGGADPRPGDPTYDLARRLGELLAARGLVVVNGGYGGVMEGASRGAREAGGRAIGVTTDAFQDRGAANPYLTREIREPDLVLRTRTLVELAAGFVVLPGRAGTLAELALLWALQRAGHLGPRPVVLLGETWAALLEPLFRMDVLEATQRKGTRVAGSPEEAVGLIQLGLDSFERFRNGEPGI